MIEKYLERQTEIKKKSREGILGFLMNGWQLDLHDSKHHLKVWRDGQQVLLSHRFTATSPRGQKYHGDNCELTYGPYNINLDGHKDFENELCDRNLFNEIDQAFKLFNYGNNFNDEELLEILTEQFK